jgi:DNA polymerase I-like protein with 3'-5' exonuclease and polymerase domains
MDKFRGTFVQGYIIDGSVDGVVHCQFNQLRGEDGGAVSGRFSSSNPNLQNLPIRDEELGALIRRVFLPDDGQLWWKFDWSQIEFRLAVHFAALMKLKGAADAVQAYLHDPNTDYHVLVSKLTGLSRKFAKSINFGLVYGMGIEELCRQLGIDVQQGYRILRTYHTNVPFVKPLYNTASNRANDKGEIITLLGRHRRFHVWNKGNSYYRESEMRENEIDFKGWQRAFTHKALNAVLQGSAADIMKQGMVQIWESGVCDTLGAPHLTVHDELDGSLPPGNAGLEALAEVKNIMQTCVKLELPLRADGGTGPNWGNTGD